MARPFLLLHSPRRFPFRSIARFLDASLFALSINLALPLATLPPPVLSVFPVLSVSGPPPPLLQALESRALSTTSTEHLLVSFALIKSRYQNLTFTPSLGSRVCSVFQLSPLPGPQLSPTSGFPSGLNPTSSPKWDSRWAGSWDTYFSFAMRARTTNCL